MDDRRLRSAMGARFSVWRRFTPPPPVETNFADADETLQLLKRALKESFSPIFCIYLRRSNTKRQIFFSEFSNRSRVLGDLISLCEQLLPHPTWICKVEETVRDRRVSSVKRSVRIFLLRPAQVVLWLPPGKCRKEGGISWPLRKKEHSFFILLAILFGRLANFERTNSGPFSLPPRSLLILQHSGQKHSVDCKSTRW